METTYNKSIGDRPSQNVHERAFATLLVVKPNSGGSYAPQARCAAFCAKSHCLVALVAVFGVLVSGCKPPAAANTAAEEVPKVTVTKVVSEEGTVNYEEFQGRTEASESIDVRSRVYGFIESVDFKDGDRVKQDQLLFTIE